GLPGSAAGGCTASATSGTSHPTVRRRAARHPPTRTRAAPGTRGRTSWRRRPSPPSPACSRRRCGTARGRPGGRGRRGTPRAAQPGGSSGVLQFALDGDRVWVSGGVGEGVVDGDAGTGHGVAFGGALLGPLDRLGFHAHPAGCLLARHPVGVEEAHLAEVDPGGPLLPSEAERLGGWVVDVVPRQRRRPARAGG